MDILEVRFTGGNAYEVLRRQGEKTQTVFVPNDPKNSDFQELIKWFQDGGYPQPPRRTKAPGFFWIRTESWAAFGWFVGIVAAILTVAIQIIFHFIP